VVVSDGGNNNRRTQDTKEREDETEARCTVQDVKNMHWREVRSQGESRKPLSGSSHGLQSTRLWVGPTIKTEHVLDRARKPTMHHTHQE
jgi:hypothetical protein